MEGPRAPIEVEYTHLLKFLDQTLRPEHGWSISAEYPTTFHPANIHNMRIIKSEGEVLAHAVLRPTLVKTPVGFFKLGAIGSVVTNEKYRNQGLSRQVIDDCLQLANEQSCEIAILWTNLYDFYRKFGFELAGTEYSYTLAGELPAPALDLRFMCSPKVDPSAIYRLYSQHTVATIRTVDEIRRYLEIPNARVYTAWDRNGTLQAFAIEGKGADLTGYIHEWGGGLSKLIPLFNFMLQDQKKPLTLIVPRHSESLVRKFSDYGIDPHVGYLGMIKLLAYKGVFSKINRHARLTLGLSEFMIGKDNDTFYVGERSKPYTTKSETDIIKLLFGPWQPSQMQGLDTKTVELLEKIFPLKMWVWGWDSI